MICFKIYLAVHEDFIFKKILKSVVNTYIKAKIKRSERDEEQEK